MLESYILIGLISWCVLAMRHRNLIAEHEQPVVAIVYMLILCSIGWPVVWVHGIAEDLQ